MSVHFDFAWDLGAGDKDGSLTVCVQDMVMTSDLGRRRLEVGGRWRGPQLTGK